MPELDNRFLTPHPRTVLWLEQKIKCLQCANLKSTRYDGGVHEMRCRAQFNNVKFPVYCIDAREPGANCGPNANLFKGKI